MATQRGTGRSGAVGDRGGARLSVDPNRLATAATAAGMAATVVVTWPLWRSRGEPPNLPAVDALARAPWGPVLLALCAAALVRPRIAGPLLAIVTVAAIAGDQLRLQPEVLSLALLLVLLPFEQGRTVARWHLASLWLWAGLNKALGLGWPEGDARYIADALGSIDLRPAIVVVVPAVEVALGLSVLVRRAHQWTAIGGAALHLGIFLTLSPALGDANIAVWPWNLALAVIASLLFWSNPPAGRGPVTTAAAAVLLLCPALFYVGSADAYATHHVYSGATASAVVCDASGCRRLGPEVREPLEVPIPPEPRLFRALFLETCEPGSTLQITGIRTRLTGTPTVTEVPCSPSDRGAP
ncbi:MAG: MauE/DoxX family redox-associated membrane protein [Acidimicrobiales bacterium]